MAAASGQADNPGRALRPARDICCERDINNTAGDALLLDDGVFDFCLSTEVGDPACRFQRIEAIVCIG